MFSFFLKLLITKKIWRPFYFDTPLDVLKHIKYSGTNSIKTLNWTVSKLKTFEEYYRQNFSSGMKVTLTYNPIYVVLKLN